MPIEIDRLPRADMLCDLCAEHGTREGLVRWMEVVGAEVELLAAFDVNELEQLRVELRDLFSNGQSCTVSRPRIREVVSRLLGAGLTLRQAARYAEVPLSRLVGMALAPQCGRRAEQIADCEEAIRNEGEIVNPSAWAKRFNLNLSSVKTLARFLDVPIVSTANTLKWPVPIRQRAIALAAAEGATPAVVRDAIRREFPEVGESFTYGSAITLMRRAGRYGGHHRAKRGVKC